MASEIYTKIQPLYDDLIKIGFHEFIGSNDFVRACNTFGLTEVYTSAHNENEKGKSENIFSLLVGINHDLLARFMNLLFKNESGFPSHLARLIVEYLKNTDRPVYPEGILDDLAKLGLQGEDYTKLANGFAVVQNDYYRKAVYLKNIMTALATANGGSYEMYERLRKDLVKNASLKSYLPEFVVNCSSAPDFWQFIKSSFGTYKDRRAFLTESFTPLITFLEHSPVTPMVEVTVISNLYVQETWKKAIDRMGQDPEGAITTARALLESVCKHILDVGNEPYDETADLPKLYKSAVKQLQFSPDQHSEQIFKQILGGCQSVVEGLGSLRNKLSDAHGKSTRTVRPSTRHASLAVNLSGTMCQFLLQTLEAKQAASN